MDKRLEKALESYTSSSETLDDVLDSISSSPSSNYETPDDRSDSPLYLDAIQQPLTKFSYSHWSQPWTPQTHTNTYTYTYKSSAADYEILKPFDSSCSDQWLASNETHANSVVGAGLANLGNTCFLNAVLQCFTHTIPLVQGLLSCNHAMTCDCHSDDGFCVLCAFRDHVEVSLASTITVVSPLKLVDNLSYFSSSFRRYRQEDAHEFLQCFLDRLESCCNGSKTEHTTLSLQDDNFVKQGFGGCLISKLRCCNCGHCSDTYEPSIDLSLEIENVDSLQTALESFTKVEKIEDVDTKFTCENCKEEVLVEKQLMLEQAPSVTALHLKRFKNYGSYVEKIDKYVEFPLELDLLPYTSGSRNNNQAELKYDLYAVVVHIGVSSTSGHYYCFIRTAPDTWYKFDDSKVMKVREDFVLSQEAYILFYAKQGTPWFSSLMETQKPSLDPNVSNTSPKSVLDNVDPTRTSSSSIANNHSFDAKENSDASDGISTEYSNGLRYDHFEGTESKDASHTYNTPATVRESNAAFETPFKAEKIYSTSNFKENNTNHEFSEVKINGNITPRRPLDLLDYEDDSPVSEIYIVRNHPRSADQVCCKRQLNKELENPERKEACRILKKSSMPGSRCAKLLAAMEGPHSEGSLNNKRSRRMEFYPRRDDSPSSSRRKPNLNSVTRPLSAGSFR